jgi:hypothetical protein
MRERGSLNTPKKFTTLSALGSGAGTPAIGGLPGEACAAFSVSKQRFRYQRVTAEQADDMVEKLEPFIRVGRALLDPHAHHKRVQRGRKRKRPILAI